ncbi:hypothetical protein PFLUV_G00206720 [Perca fluviatilis]|uniref:Uncharacterized protein n=1 Tax=Perca fluviatilis TaxID=8168 RepID=A0A6A5EQ67_PERFL|nr:hypothetical protein PFLUV_G00206720 [Perca fluviatilis]
MSGVHGTDASFSRFESQVPVQEACGPSDPGPTEAGRCQRRDPGLHQEPAELQHEDLVAADFRPTLPPRIRPETSRSCSDPAGGPRGPEEGQAACAAGGGGAAAPAGDGGEDGDSGGETGEDERTSQSSEREKRDRQAEDGLREDGSAVQVNRETDRQKMVSEKMDQLFR